MNPEDARKAKELEGTMHHARFLKECQQKEEQTAKALDTTTIHNERWRTFQQIKGRCRKHETADGHSVFRWPEFQAFMQRLGVDVEAPITDITIKIPCDDVVEVILRTNTVDMLTDKP